MVGVTVTNSGPRDGSTVVQLYVTDDAASDPRPAHQLTGAVASRGAILENVSLCWYFAYGWSRSSAG